MRGFEAGVGLPLSVSFPWVQKKDWVRLIGLEGWKGDDRGPSASLMRRTAGVTSKGVRQRLQLGEWGRQTQQRVSLMNE